MFNWKFIDKTVLYDGSFNGLLSLAFDLYNQKQIPKYIIAENKYIPNLLDNVEFHTTNEVKYTRIYNGIVNNISYSVLYDCYYTFLSNEKNKELEIIKYILNGFKVGSKITTMLYLDYVLYVQKIRKKVFGEAHRLKGLVRLIEIQENLFYSSIHPDNNVVENVGQFLMKRFPSQNIILHDKNRSIAFLYNTKQYTLVNVNNNFSICNKTEKEKDFSELWKTFFNTISIKERTNKRLQMQYMPKKYWKDLIEKPE